MCGIVGYVGAKQAQPVLFDCLSRMEYRGYDSCGIAVVGSPVKVIKDAIRVGPLSKSCPQLVGTAGIGHTRWATHGPPTAANAHPHSDCSSRFAVVHNGVINNYQALRRQLGLEGHVFLSETDTEVIPHLVEKYFTGNLEEAVTRGLQDVEGTYAIAVLMADSHQLVVARKDSPLVIGLCDNGDTLVASDVPAILDYATRVIYLENGQIGVLTPTGAKILKDGVEQPVKTHNIEWSSQSMGKAGYEHYMLKEIHEQPRVVADTLLEYSASQAPPIFDSGQSKPLILACGTSYHAGLIARHVFQGLLGTMVRVELASEFACSGQVLNATDGIIITQSGETADCLAALRKLSAAKVRTTALTNVPHSTVSRMATRVLYTRAGPEVSVAATKTFIAQLALLSRAALSCPWMDGEERQTLLADLDQLPAAIQHVLDDERNIAALAEHIACRNNVFLIGKGISYPVALEGALKLKEIAYIHAEGYPAGELKHGSLALVDEKTPIIAIAPKDHTYEAMLTAIREVKARKAPVIAIVDEGDQLAREFADYAISVPRTSRMLTPILNTVVLQLIAYHAARKRECPIDFPRNLAKSVTVE